MHRVPHRPGPHFTWLEMGNPPARHRLRTIHLVNHLEALREARGHRRLRVISAYRSSARNRAVGGASRSQHLWGAAADIPAGYATVSQAVDAGFTGIGSSGQWATHVDVRPGPLVRWAY